MEKIIIDFRGNITLKQRIEIKMDKKKK